MPRKPRDQLFKKSDFYRIVEATKAKGLTVTRIDVTRDGLSVFVGNSRQEDEVNNAVAMTDEHLKTLL